jgi:hypothetical protein
MKTMNYNAESLIKAMRENKIFYLNIEVDVIDVANDYCSTRKFHFARISMYDVMLHEHNIPIHIGKDFASMYGVPEIDVIPTADWDNQEGSIQHTFTTHTWRVDGEIVGQVRMKSSYMRECDATHIPNSIVHD